MAKRSNTPTFDEVKSGTITATEAGAAGPAVTTGMIYFSLYEAATANVKITDADGAGGVEMLPGRTYGPFPADKASLYKFKTNTGGGNQTVGYLAHR